MAAIDVEVSIIELNKKIERESKMKKTHKRKVKDSYKHLHKSEREMAYEEEEQTEVKKETSGDDVHASDEPDYESP